MFRKMFALLFFAAAFAAAVNAQCFERSELGRVLAGPCIERVARQAYAPVDYILGQLGSPYGFGGLGGYGYGGYGYGSGRLGTSAIVGGVAGAITGGLVAYATARGGNRTTYVAAPDGEQAYYASAPQGREVRFAVSKPQKPLDCRKPSGKRGKNEAACAAAEQEQARREEEARAESERRAIAASPWRLYNRSGFTVEVFDGDRKLGRMRPNQSWRVLEPVSGFQATILAPDFSGAISEHEARIRPSSDFQAWVITSPRVEE